MVSRTVKKIQKDPNNHKLNERKQKRMKFFGTVLVNLSQAELEN